MQGDLRPESSGAIKNAAETGGRSPLDKPLSLLTEEDIAQLTREDCRRFLKEKGMRRPSWNKSQAIQQVISLKALLEGRPESGELPVGAGYRQKPPPRRPASLPSLPEAAGDSKATAAAAKEPSPSPSPSLSPYRRRDPIPPIISAGGPSCRFPVAGRDQQPPETPSPSLRVTAEVPAGQMTIFYDGKVNVYSDVTVDKARAILLLAGRRDCYGAAALPGPVHSPQPAFLGPGQGPVPTAPPLAAALPTSPAGRLAHRFGGPSGVPRGKSSLVRERSTSPEGPTSRKASLQRYLEKRKDRLKGRKTLGGASSSSMEIMYLSQKFGGQMPNEQLSRSNTSSPTQPRPPGTPTRCSSIENQAQKNHLSVDLNDDGCGN